MASRGFDRLPRLPATGPLAEVEVLGHLGAGGMATVYRVRERSTGRELALKLMRDQQRNSQRQGRFAREARITASFNHPGIVRVHGAGFAGEQGYILCELVEGARGLDAAAADRPQRERVELVRDAARALGHAHSQGVVHRDVKPDNLLVGDDGRLRVADFGLASAMEVERLTRSGAVMGTPHYMAPEQVTAERGSMGPHTDVWALGVVLYQVLTGHLPFAGESFVELAAKITTAEPDLLRKHDAGAPSALEAIVIKTLDKDPAERYANGDELADDLQRYLDGNDVIASGVRTRLRRKARRAALLVVPLLLGAAALVFALTWSPQAPAKVPPEQLTQAPQEEADSTPTPMTPPEATPSGPSEDEILAADLAEVEGKVPDILGDQVRAGSPSAYAGMANMYRVGAGAIKVDMRASIRWLRRAADGGHPSSQESLGSDLVEGTDWVKQDVPEGLRYLGLAADQDQVGALRKLGAIYLRGELVARDRPKAVALLEEASERGEHTAREILGLEYYSTGGEAEQRRAVELLRMGHDNDRPTSSRFLGLMLIEGKGTKKDVEGGLNVILEPAEMGDVDALLTLGELYEGRLGVGAFQPRTYRYYSRAVLVLRTDVSDGKGRALVRLAHMYWLGRGVPRSVEEALKLLDKYLETRPSARKAQKLRNAMAEGSQDLIWPTWAEVRMLPER